MKKNKIKLLCAVVAIMLVVAFAGCGNEVETIVGTWESPDGYTLVLTEDSLSLTNYDHENALSYESIPYYWTGKTLNVTVEGQTFAVFETYLSEDTLKLTYLPALDDSEKPKSITLTRVKESGMLSSCVE